MSTRERVVPTKSLLTWRKMFLHNLRDLIPEEPADSGNISLDIGNTKLGKEGRFYKSVYVWNLPSVATCPGASEWCLENCYNADDRKTVFPIKRWAENWWLYLNNPEVLRNNIINQLNNTEEPCAVRIHSSGDFYSTDYIGFWINVAKQNKQVKFWAYTRSWIIDRFHRNLDELRSLCNVELFASWDSTMDKSPPADWRKSYVFYTENDANNFCKKTPKTFICPEQIGIVKNCASCNFCMKRLNKDIVFYFH